MGTPVTYAEMQGFPQGRWNNGEFDGHRRLKVAWASAAELLSQLEGTTWPYSTGPNNCYGWRADIKPFPGCQQGGSGSEASYDWALVDIYYTTRGPTHVSHLGGYVKETLSPYTRTSRVNHSGLYWSTATAIAANEAPTATWHGSKYQITYSNLTIPPANFLNYSGCVNSNTVASYTLSMSFLPQTLLYAGTVTSVNYGWGQSPRWSASHRFEYWPPGHNTFYRQGGFVCMYTDAAEADKFLLYPLTYFGT